MVQLPEPDDIKDLPDEEVDLELLSDSEENYEEDGEEALG